MLANYRIWLSLTKPYKIWYNKKSGEKIMQVKTHKGNLINIELREIDNYYRAAAIDNDGSEMGFVTFVPKKDKTIWLQKIETYPKYQGHGVADALLSVMEYFAVQNRMLNIDGKYFPENEAAVKFYEKYGYEHYKEDYEHYLSKRLSPSQVISENKDKIFGYEVIEQDLTIKK